MVGSLQDVNSAITVHNNLQGAILASSDRGGMRLQYPFFLILFISGYIEVMFFLFCPSLQEFFNIFVLS